MLLFLSFRLFRIVLCRIWKQCLFGIHAGAATCGQEETSRIAVIPGNARVSRADPFSLCKVAACAIRKVRDGEGAIARTRAAHAPQSYLLS
jgi:hypothetical protein